MKRFYISVAMLIITVAISIWVHVATNKRIDLMISSLTDFEAAFEVDTSHAESQFDSVMEIWKKSRGLIGTVLSHDEKKEIDGRYAQIEELSDLGESDECIILSQEIRRYLRTAADSFSPHIRNIL